MFTTVQNPEIFNINRPAKSAYQDYVDSILYNLKVTDSGFFVNPIRENVSNKSLYYNIDTKEITYGSIVQGLPTGSNWGNYIYYNGMEWIVGGNNIKLGNFAGVYDQEESAIAIGPSAGYQNQKIRAIAIGLYAGQNTQGDSSLAIGSSAGNILQGTGSIAFGSNAGHTNQGQKAITIGTNASYQDQGTNAISIGEESGHTSQGVKAIAIGQNAGRTGQGFQAIAIGSSAGYQTQGVRGIAIGTSAGYNSQQDDSIAIGTNSGKYAGTNTITIGKDAGSTAASPVPSGCVVIGTGFDTTSSYGSNANATFIKPLRVVNSVAGLQQVYYNPSTGEMVYYQP